MRRTLIDGRPNAMTTTQIPDASVMSALRSVVAERGPHAAYPDAWRDEEGRCVYTLQNGQPACIVGAVFEKLGQLHLLAGRRGPIGQQDVPVSHRAMALLIAAQRAQDTGLTWGWVMKHAEATYADLAGSAAR